MVKLGPSKMDFFYMVMNLRIHRATTPFASDVLTLVLLHMVSIANCPMCAHPSAAHLAAAAWVNHEPI